MKKAHTFTFSRPDDPQELTRKLLWLGSFTNTVNAADWRGHPAGSVICTQVDAWFADGELRVAPVPPGAGWPTRDFNDLEQA